MLFKKGKITSQLPDDTTKKFNFGAFFGTWIWGLFNKVYYPLWQIILTFTPFSFHFSLICGLKGNEWALKAKKYDNIENFNSKQETQGLIFGIISLCIIPALIFITYVGLITFIIAGVINNPKKTEKTINKIQKVYMEAAFTECAFEKESNICYVRNEVWEETDFRDKTRMLEIVASYAADEKNKNISKSDYLNRATKYKELPKTKLYSEDKTKLIGEYKPSNRKENQNFLETVQDSINAYKFYPISK